MLRRQVNYKAAENLFQQALKSYKTIAGPEHCMNNPAVMFKRQYKYEAAEAISQQTLAAREETVGPHT